MTDNKAIPISEKNYQMCVFFKIERAHKIIIDGSFIITSQSGISCVGENHQVELGFDQNHIFKVGIFKGVILEHKIEDELATISITMLDVIDDQSSSIGVKQIVTLQTGISMGISAGSKSEESIAIGPDHILFYRTILFRRKST